MILPIGHVKTMLKCLRCYHLMDLQLRTRQLKVSLILDNDSAEAML